MKPTARLRSWEPRQTLREYLAHIANNDSTRRPYALRWIAKLDK